MGPGQVQLIRIDNFHVAGLEGDFFPAHLAHAAAPDAIIRIQRAYDNGDRGYPTFPGDGGAIQSETFRQEMERESAHLPRMGEFFG